MRALLLLLLAGCGAGVSPQWTPGPVNPDPDFAAAADGGTPASWSLIAGAWGTDARTTSAGLQLDGNAELESDAFPLEPDAGLALQVVFANDDGRTTPQLAVTFFAADGGALSAVTGFTIPPAAASTWSTWSSSTSSPANTASCRIGFVANSAGAELHLVMGAFRVTEPCR